MLVIVASRQDTVAQSLAERWDQHDAAVLSCQDLSTSGWHHRLGSPQSSCAVIAGRLVPARDISAVLTRIPAVMPHELVSIAQNDRQYVALEMTAFLLSWLTSLQVPVLNRPAPGNLAGPNWSRERWVHAAASLGIPTRPIHRHLAVSREAEPEEPVACRTSVIVVGEQCFGAADVELEIRALQLAQAVGAQVLGVEFDSPDASGRMVRADPCPDISSPQVADAVLTQLQRREG